MSTLAKQRVAVVLGLIGLLCSSMAAAAPADVSGTWSIIGNRHAGSLEISQGAAATQCKPIRGTIYPGTTVKGDVIGYYCPATGRIAFTRRNASGVAIQAWIGNLSEVAAGQPLRMGGTFHALDSPAGAGTLGEYNFQGQK
jgi:hypothetical protein